MFDLDKLRVTVAQAEKVHELLGKAGVQADLHFNEGLGRMGNGHFEIFPEDLPVVMQALALGSEK